MALNVKLRVDMGSDTCSKGVSAGMRHSPRHRSRRVNNAKPPSRRTSGAGAGRFEAVRRTGKNGRGKRSQTIEILTASGDQSHNPMSMKTASTRNPSCKNRFETMRGSPVAHYIFSLN